MSKLTLIHDNEAELTLEPTDASDTPEAVCFDVSFQWSMPFQECQIRIRQCWIGSDALRNFERELAELLGGQAGAAALRTLEEREFLAVRLDGNTASVSISATDTTRLGECTFRINTYRSQLSEIRDRLRNYAKWW